MKSRNLSCGGVCLSVGDYMGRRRTAGLLILKDGEIALERCGADSGPERRWQSYSTPVPACRGLTPVLHTIHARTIGFPLSMGGRPATAPA
jgi:hypothetical protein